METEVVVTMEEGLLQNIQDLARSRGKSISEMVADYFHSIVLLSRTGNRQSPILSEISGVLHSDSQVTERKDRYKKHLVEKYL